MKTLEQIQTDFIIFLRFLVFECVNENLVDFFNDKVIQRYECMTLEEKYEVFTIFLKGNFKKMRLDLEKAFQEMEDEQIKIIRKI